jgi:gamma-F420-2:alpha-L-glutamate ligase
MLGWLLYSKKDVEKNKGYIEFYKEEGRKLDIKIELVIMENLEFGIKNNEYYMLYEKSPIIRPDFVISRTIYPLLTKQIETMGIPVFNNSFVSEICNDKAKTYQYVAKLGIDMVDSAFYNGDRIRDVLSNVYEPTVIKAVAGHGGSQVFLIDKLGGIGKSTTVEQEEEVVELLEQSDFVVQPLTGTKKEDLRVYVIGKKIIAAILRRAKSGFKSNFSLGGEVMLYNLNEKEVNIINQIIAIFDFDMVGIDFIIGDNGDLIFNEIEDVVGARMLYQCTDINLVKLYLEYILKKLKGKSIEVE